MLRRLRIARVICGCIGLLFALGIARGLLWTQPLPAAPAAATSHPGPVPGQDPGPERGPLGRYSPIPSRNLFSPNRTEPTTVVRVEIGVKPIVRGVVVGGPKSRAYLEDSTTKRVVGYAIGDRVAGGRLQTVRSDHVLIARPNGVLEVLLADPATPRPTSSGVTTAAGSRVPPAAAVFPPGGSIPAPGLTQGQESATAPAVLTSPSLIQPSRSVPR